MKLNSIINILEKKLKLKEQEAWDNSGLQVGCIESDIKNIMLTLDIDIEIVEFAVANQVDLIITHHPLLFSGLKSIDFSTFHGKIIKTLIKNNINLYSMHTNYDMADLGVNYKLAEKLDIKDYEVLHIVNDDKSGYGGIGYIEPIDILSYARQVKKMLNNNNIKLFTNNEDLVINKVAFCGGSGSDFILDAINKKADIYITGDIKYHQAQTALQNNLSVIDAGHYYTENPALENIKMALNNLPELNISLLEKNTVKEIILEDKI